MENRQIRLGVDLGGTKIAITALDAAEAECFAHRVATPRNDYAATLDTIAQLVERAENALDCAGAASIGVGMPGSISPNTGKVQNANSNWLNDRRLDADLTKRIGRPIRFANDANCLALSESADGAGRGAASVFGVIIGTGCGGGFVHNGELVNGPRGISGEWGHNPLPWALPEETPGPECWCGLRGCLERWLCGPGMHRDYLDRGGDAGRAPTALDVCTLAKAGDGMALAALDRHASRLARGLASVVNILDPDVIVLGGGLSQIDTLYETVPTLMAPYIFADCRDVVLLPPVHGDASGARGAARLWDVPSQHVSNAISLTAKI